MKDSEKSLNLKSGIIFKGVSNIIPISGKNNQILSCNHPDYNSGLSNALNNVLLYTELIFECDPGNVINNNLGTDDYKSKFGVEPL